MKQLALGVRLRADANFESFVPGANAEIIAALRGDEPVPLWLWGAHGAGKTHLLQALCTASEPGIACSAGICDGAAGTAAYFALGQNPEFPPDALLGYENYGIVCVDDVHHAAGVAPWERSLFRLFNECLESKHRLVFAADAPPRRLAFTLEDWRSRAAACTVYQVHELDETGRVAALTLRAAQRGLELPAETAEYLLRRMPRDLLSLYRLLDRLDEASLIAQRRLTVPFIRDALEASSERKP